MIQFPHIFWYVCYPYRQKAEIRDWVVLFTFLFKPVKRQWLDCLMGTYQSLEVGASSLFSPSETLNLPFTNTLGEYLMLMVSYYLLLCLICLIKHLVSEKQSPAVQTRILETLSFWTGYYLMNNFLQFETRMLRTERQYAISGTPSRFLEFEYWLLGKLLIYL